MVFCPRCEDRGMDIPVLMTIDAKKIHHNCKCFQCHFTFCGLCRSPCHSNESCFASERRIVRMARRRPPLPLDLAELATLRAEEILKNDRMLAEVAMAKSRGADFTDFRKQFKAIHGEVVIRSLESIWGTVELKATKLAEEVEERFLRQLSKMDGPNGQLRPAFRGTYAKNYPSIFSRGLLIPGLGDGADLPIVHGAAHGRGIYTANIDAPWLSKGFCDDHSMLVCAVLDFGSEHVRQVRDAMVVFHPDCVVPLFLATGETSVNTPVATSVAPSWVNTLAAKAAAKAAPQSSSKPKQITPVVEAKPKPKQKKFLAKLASQKNRH